MDCPDCGSETLAVTVPAQYREDLPGEETGIALCTHCLAMHPAADPPAEPPDFQRLSDAMPSNPDAALPMALLVGLLSNLALYREEISDLLGAVERAGTDPLLVLDRLARDPELAPETDLAGRRRQLEQLI
ncbi:DUF6276 family protein [Salinibaculum rarum]|uniref:DUF6276 family protein n=1 Tax=Salinibaculum rarum TaxID=3058903 RepID=UPI00265F3372|nr:DUF6276 family protein [Salinibaculum sp. KK48]